MFYPGDVIRYNHPKFPEWKKNLLAVIDFSLNTNSIFCFSLNENNFMPKGSKATFLDDGYFEKVEIKVEEKE
jgi:hypothetical protein